MCWRLGVVEKIRPPLAHPPSYSSLALAATTRSPIHAIEVLAMAAIGRVSQLYLTQVYQPEFNAGFLVGPPPHFTNSMSSRGEANHIKGLTRYGSPFTLGPKGVRTITRGEGNQHGLLVDQLLDACDQILPDIRVQPPAGTDPIMLRHPDNSHKEVRPNR